jgi:PqqA peptide cyclase
MRKLQAACLITEEGLPLTIKFVIHRQNCARVPKVLALTRKLGASRVEIAHTQYHGWALINRAALLPDRTQFDAASRAVEQGRAQYGSSFIIDYVTPDYHASQPKPCMGGGWGQRFLNVTPSGRVLPCHAAESILGMEFLSVRTAGLRAIWNEAPAFRRFRGTDWMSEPCRSCTMKEVDWSGCRCQALQLAGNASLTDPVCARSSQHAKVEKILTDRPIDPPALLYRRIGAQTKRDASGSASFHAKEVGRA